MVHVHCWLPSLRTTAPLLPARWPQCCCHSILGSYLIQAPQLLAFSTSRGTGSAAGREATTWGESGRAERGEARRRCAGQQVFPAVCGLIPVNSSFCLSYFILDFCCFQRKESDCGIISPLPPQGLVLSDVEKTGSSTSPRLPPPQGSDSVGS